MIEDRDPRIPTSSAVGSLPDTKEGRGEGPGTSAATRLRDAEALAARLASARRLQPKLTAALGLGAPRPTEIAALEASLDAALDEYEAAWKEAHAT